MYYVAKMDQVFIFNKKTFKRLKNGKKLLENSCNFVSPEKGESCWIQFIVNLTGFKPVFLPNIWNFMCTRRDSTHAR